MKARHPASAHRVCQGPGSEVCSGEEAASIAIVQAALAIARRCRLTPTAAAVAVSGAPSHLAAIGIERMLFSVPGIAALIVWILEARRQVKPRNFAARSEERRVGKECR